MPWTLKAIIVVAALASLPLQAGHAAAGRFLSVVGDVRVVTADGDRRAADRGAEVESGETVITGDGAFAQLTMTDGARLQIREDTELKLDDYAYEEQGAGRSFMSLLRGTMRSLTGLIGKRRKEDYRVRTPHATIGIRGTDHQVTVLLKPREGFEPGTFDIVFTGRTVMQTNAGRIEIAPRQAGYVTSQTVSPQVIEVPAFLKPGPTPARAAPAASKAQARSGKAEGGRDEGGRPILKRPAAVNRLGSRTEGETPALRTPLSGPLLTPLSGTSTKTLSPESTTSTTLERSTTTLESYKTLDSTTTTKTLDPSTTTTLESYKTLDSTTTTRDLSTTTLSPTTSTKTLSPTTSTTTTTTTTKTLSPTTTLTSPTKTLSPTTTLTSPTKKISPTTTR